MDIAKLFCKPYWFITHTPSPKKGYKHKTFSCDVIGEFEVICNPQTLSVDFEDDTIIVVVDNSENSHICNNYE